MRLPIKEREFSTVIIILAVIVVIVLGVLQYRWSNQVSEATSIRLADSLQMSMINWHLDFFRVFSEICVALRVDPDSSTQDDWAQYARRYADWKKTTANPNLVAGLYIVRFDEPPAAPVLRLASAGQRFEPSHWPSNFGELREELQQSASKPGADGSSASSGETNAAAVLGANAEFTNRFYAGGPLAGWQFEPRIPALVRSVARDPSASADRQDFARNAVDWIVIALDRNDVPDNIRPALAQRYCRGSEGLDYQVAVTTGGNMGRPLYSSDAGFGNAEIADADGTMNIFGRLRGSGQGSPIHIFHTPSQENGPAASVAVT